MTKLARAWFFTLFRFFLRFLCNHFEAATTSHGNACLDGHSHLCGVHETIRLALLNLGTETFFKFYDADLKNILVRPFLGRFFDELDSDDDVKKCRSEIKKMQRKRSRRALHQSSEATRLRLRLKLHQRENNAPKVIDGEHNTEKHDEAAKKLASRLCEEEESAKKVANARKMKRKENKTR